MSDCAIHPHSSRACERGTHGCNVNHAYRDEVAKGSFVGRLESYDDYSYDGTDEHWACRTWSIHFDAPTDRGVVMVELEDVFARLDGKRVSLVVTELPGRVNG